MIFQRAGIALFSSVIIHCLLGGWLVFSSQIELGQNFQVTVEISGIETTTREQTENNPDKARSQTPALIAATVPVPGSAEISKSQTSSNSAQNETASASATASARSAAPPSQVLNSYLSQIRDKISRAIHPPRVRLLSSLKSTLRLTLMESGEVKSQEIEQSSGSPEFDHAILMALEKSRPFPPFTQEMSAIHEVTVKLPIEIRPQ